MTDYPDWQTPQAGANALAGTSLTGTGLAIESGGQLSLINTKVALPGSTIATDVSNTGVPLLTKSTAASSLSGQVIAASGTLTLGPFSLSQIGYELGIQILANAASTSPFLGVEMKWADAATGLLCGDEQWWLAGGQSSGGQSYYGTGPTKGNQLTIVLTNADTVNSLTVNMTVLQNSRAYIRDDWRQRTNITVPSFTNGNYDQQAGFLIQAAPSIAASGAATRILPLYSGQVRLWASSAAAFDVTVNAIDRNIGAAPAGNQIFEDKVTASGGGFMADALTLPRCTCTVILNNNGAGVQTIGLTMVINELLP